MIEKTWEGTLEHACDQELIKGSSMDKRIDTLRNRNTFCEREFSD